MFLNALYWVSLQIEGLFAVVSKMVTKKDDDVDVGCGNAFGSGGGEDEEGGGPAGGGPQLVNNIIDGFQYTETQIGGASDFKGWYKDYCGALIEKFKARKKGKEFIDAFKVKATAILKFLLANFGDLQFYLGPSFDSSTMVFSRYVGEDTVPTFYYILDGYDIEKF